MGKNEDIRYLLNNVQDGNVEALEVLYKRYVYYVVKIVEQFDLNDHDKAYPIVSNIVRKAIIDFSINCNYDKYSICTFIANRLRNVEYKVYPELIKPRSPDQELLRYESAAFNGDINARTHIFHKYRYIADNYARDLYNYYVLLSKCKVDNLELSISVEDMMQDYYIIIWKYINEFYNNIENKNQYISSVIIKYIKSRHKTKIKHLESKFKIEYLEDCVDELNDEEYKKIEDSCLLDYLEKKIKCKNKGVLPYLRQGYTFEEAGQKINCSKGAAHDVINVCRRYVKQNKIQR